MQKACFKCFMRKTFENQLKKHMEESEQLNKVVFLGGHKKYSHYLINLTICTIVIVVNY